VRAGRPSSAIASHRLSAVCREPTSTPRAAREALAGVGQEPLRVALDDVLERAAVDLHRVRRVLERAGEDRGPHDEVVGQRDVGLHPGDDLAHRRDVRGDVGLELVVAAVEEGAGLEPLVAVGDVDRQQAPDLRSVDGQPGLLAQGLDTERALLIPRADRVDEVELGGPALLGEQVHLGPDRTRARASWAL
jgi:hypothetical protein